MLAFGRTLIYVVEIEIEIETFMVHWPSSQWPWLSRRLLATLISLVQSFCLVGCVSWHQPKKSLWTPLHPYTSGHYTNYIIIIITPHSFFITYFIGDYEWLTVMDGASLFLVMVALCNRADHYIFALWFLSIFFFFYSSPNLSGRRLDVCHTSTHGVALVRI